MPQHKALLFDLCDTLVSLNFSMLPTVSVNGELIRSTGGLLHNVLKEFQPGIDFDEFYSVLTETTRELHSSRDRDLREITLEQRFQKILKRLNLDSGPIAKRLLDGMVSAHTDQIVRMMEFPSDHRQILGKYHGRFQLGLVSNFDHAPAVYRVLERERVRVLFQEILISAEVGWRKPSREIFQLMLDRMRLDPAETLFIGDSLLFDVSGAKQIGMETVWLNPENRPAHPDLPAPDHIIPRLTDLPDIL